ncbi:hypothetical protein SAMN04487976_11988 [Xaviernesmea oryzae]|nr:hypothetical protein SAMN04487976_11988 [Xaviernesmea oryzae]
MREATRLSLFEEARAEVHQGYPVRADTKRTILNLIKWTIWINLM